MYVSVTPLSAAELTAKQQLGKLLYFDENLSTPAGQSCASCHLPATAFVDPDFAMPVSEGVIAGRFGGRNTPPASYAMFSQPFGWDPEEGMYMGGQFWDGRAADLVEQAKGPFLNPVEMNNPDKEAVVIKVFDNKTEYPALFKSVYNLAAHTALRDVDKAYDLIADAIAAYEQSGELNKFTSKFDYYLAGEAELTADEAEGLALFNDPRKGNCAACHPSTILGGEAAPLFTDFSYDNLGVPANLNIPYYNPASPDIGLAANPMVVIDGQADAEMGKFKVPSLRNIGVSWPYMHNGVFNTLDEVVDFYNTRDTDNKWPDPEVAANVNDTELGNLGLRDDEADKIVAFLMTLTDGYRPVPPSAP